MEFESSMSQVAATMGITASEIAAGSEDYKTLEAAARQAGETTMFSASQAAEALNYLALAGYDASTAADVLPSVLNLAAAGGMDLAYASDLATDAMAALGIEASNKNLTHFGDELAKTAQKSNTSVAQLGEAILVCAGTATNAGQSLETVNTALGVLANRGIKGSEGGTHLRNVLLSLTTPTDRAAKKLEKLNVSVADSEGNIRDLGDILEDLQGSLSDLSEADRLDALNQIFNKTDIAAINALLAGTGEEWDNLKSQIESADGAMADMAETMNDNLKGKLTILGSAMEALGISVYEGISEPLKSAVDTATDGVGRITSAINEGQLQGALENIGTLFGSLASTMASALTGALNIAIPLLSALGEHIGGISTAVEMAVAAILGFKAAATVVTVIESLQKAFLSLSAVISANPFTLAAAAAAALGVAFAKVSKSLKESKKEFETAGNLTGELTESVNETTEAVEKLKKAESEKMQTAMYDVDKVQRYADELSRLVDENGRVKESDRDRAQFLIGELNSALGTEISMTDGVISKYHELGGEIETLIAKKRIMTALETMDGSYSDMVTQRGKAYRQYGEAMAGAKEQLQRINELTQQYNELASDPAQDIAAAEVGLHIEYAKNAYIEYMNDATNAMDTIGETSLWLADQSALLEASQSGDLEKMNAALAQWTQNQVTGYSTAASAGSQAAQTLKDDISQQLITAQSLWDNYQTAQDAASRTAYEGAVQQLANTVQSFRDTGADINELVPIFQAAGINVGEALGGGTGEGTQNSEQTLMQAIAQMLNGASADAAAQAQTAGIEVGEGFTEGAAEGTASGGGDIAASMEGAVEDASDEAKEVARAGGSETADAFGEGASSSAGKSKGNLITAFLGLVEEALVPTAHAAEPAGEAVGESYTEGAVSGISGGAGEMAAAAEASGQQAGQSYKSGFTSGVQGASAEVQQAGQETGESYTEGAESGVEAGSGVVSAAASSSISSAASAASGAASSGGGSVGAALAAGIARGISSGAGAIRAAATAAVNSAVAAAKAAADIHSPSRVMRDEVGAMLVEGIAVGITSRIDKVPEAFENMIDDIELQLELGAINEAEYYKKLEEYRDEYLSKGSDEWWRYTKEIIKYEDELTEEQRDREFKRLENLKELRIISERDYYLRLEELRDEYFEKGSDEWEKYTLDIAKYWQGVTDDMIDSYGDMADRFSDAIDEVHDKQGELKDTFDSFAALSHPVTLTLEKQGVEYDQTLDVLNTDFDDYAQEVKKWAETMETVRDRDGMSEAYMQKLLEQDAGTAYSLAEQLMRLSDEDFKQLMQSYDDMQSVIDSVSREFYAKEEAEAINAADAYTASFIDELADGIADINEIMAQAGYEGAGAFIDEFLAQLDTFSADWGGAGATVITGSGAVTNQYNTYTFNGSGETSSQLLRSARNETKLERLRGGY